MAGFKSLKLLGTLLSIVVLAGTKVGAVDIVAHRGASYDAPENTVAAARLAWEQRADAVEVDIYLTADGKIAGFHDRTLRRTAGVDLPVEALSWAEMRELDAGSWKDARFAGEKIPSLDEIIATLPPGKRLFVEIKVGKEILPELEAALRRTGMGPAQIVFIGFGYEVMEALKKRLPAYPAMWLVNYSTNPDVQAKAPGIDEVIRLCRAAGLDGLDLNYRWPIDAAFVRKVRAAGLQLHVWTVNDAEVARALAAAGVDSITTDRPGWLREQLRR